MQKRLLLGLVAFGMLAFAAKNTFNVTLYQDSVVEGKTLKAGDYKVSMESGTAIIKQGKQVIAVPAREETEASKTYSTELLYEENSNLHAILLGGTTTKIVFEGAAPMQTGQ
jgi:hypothetical protein